jgi:hypothetical protein
MDKTPTQAAHDVLFIRSDDLEGKHEHVRGCVARSASLVRLD